VGDSAIWLGALAALHAIGAPVPAYTCDADSYDRRALARAVGEGIILFTGGGSFGDVWERHLLFRERVVADFPRHRIIQLPESVHFQRAESLARARTVFNAHPDVTILARDAASLAVVNQEFRATTMLVPDMALALGPLGPTTTPSHDVLWLKRSDVENRWPDVPGPTDGHATDWIVDDWIIDDATPLIQWSNRLRREAVHRSWLRPIARPLLSAAHPRLAAQRLARGVSLLSSARVIVTDRLHGHILALMLGIPHVVLDNSYGKLHRFVAAWTSQSPLVHLADDPRNAAALARTLLPATHT
jgi:pyruvyl transferase EpsO